MSLQMVREMVAELPPALREQIIGYAESVDRALPDLFREAGRKLSPKLGNQIVFIAGVKKLHSLTSSAYWTLDTSGKLLHQLDITDIRIGSQDVSRGGEIHGRLESALAALTRAIGDELSPLLYSSWTEIIRTLKGNGRQRN